VRIAVLAAVLALAGCGDDGGAVTDAAVSVDAPETLADADLSSGWKMTVPLPERVSNNAVAAVMTSQGCVLMTAMGIDFTREHPGIHRRVYTHLVGSGDWQQRDDVPANAGLVAASAVSLGGNIYVLGGYSVAPNGSETTSAGLYRLDPATGSWTTLAPLPVAVDDAVAVAWRDRWIVVVSGWSNTQPVDNVQLFDSQTGMWAQATAFPGAAVFGHAGAIAGDDLIVIDGVRALPGIGFADVNQTWRGRLDPQNPTQITWTDLGSHALPMRYRAAAGTLGNLVLFHGGTDDPYNFDGLSYATGNPSAPEAGTLVYDTSSEQFVDLGNATKPTATMDHRGLIECAGTVYTIGGMTAGPTVVDQVWRYRM